MCRTFLHRNSKYLPYISGVQKVVQRQNTTIYGIVKRTYVWYNQNIKNTDTEGDDYKWILTTEIIIWKRLNDC